VLLFYRNKFEIYPEKVHHKKLDTLPMNEKGHGILPCGIKGNYTECEMNDLMLELKSKIIECLDLIDTNPEDIEDDEPIVGGRHGIDSIDVLELVMMIERDYDVKIETKEQGEKIFASVRALSEYIEKNRPK
jgi:acyl carrier protein